MRLSLFSDLDAAARADLARQLNATRAYERRPALEALLAAEPQLGAQLDVADREAVCKTSGPVVDAAVARAAESRSKAALSVVSGLAGHITSAERRALADGVEADLESLVWGANVSGVRSVPAVAVHGAAAEALKRELVSLLRGAAADVSILERRGSHAPRYACSCNDIYAFLLPTDQEKVGYGHGSDFHAVVNAFAAIHDRREPDFSGQVKIAGARAARAAHLRDAAAAIGALFKVTASPTSFATPLGAAQPAKVSSLSPSNPVVAAASEDPLLPFLRALASSLYKVPL